MWCLVVCYVLCQVVTESLYDVFTGCWPEGEILGVDRNADSKAIKKAYYQVDLIPLLISDRSNDASR